MKIYEKPIVSVDAGLAEGVYAASGSSSSKLSISDGGIVADWGNDNGQRKFFIDMTGVEDGKTSITLQFNSTISNCWGGGANVNVSGQEAKLTWYSMPKGTIEIFVQVDSNINNLKITGYRVE